MFICEKEFDCVDCPRIDPKESCEHWVEVEQVSHGKWILEREPNGRPYCFHCSVCDGDFHHIGIKSATKYCPNCGAKMDLEAL